MVVQHCSIHYATSLEPQIKLLERWIYNLSEDPLRTLQAYIIITLATIFMQWLLYSAAVQ